VEPVALVDLAAAEQEEMALQILMDLTELQTPAAAVVVVHISMQRPQKAALVDLELL
jgi:hypothetical protein